MKIILLTVFLFVSGVALADQNTPTGYPVGAPPQPCVGWNCAPGS